MVEGAADLLHVLPYLYLWEWSIILTGVLDLSLEVSPFSPLGRNDQFIIVDEGVEVPKMLS
jgi:hypothetical protein